MQNFIEIVTYEISVISNWLPFIQSSCYIKIKEPTEVIWNICEKMSSTDFQYLIVIILSSGVAILQVVSGVSISWPSVGN